MQCGIRHESLFCPWALARLLSRYQPVIRHRSAPADRSITARPITIPCCGTIITMAVTGHLIAPTAPIDLTGRCAPIAPSTPDFRARRCIAPPRRARPFTAPLAADGCVKSYRPVPFRYATCVPACGGPGIYRQFPAILRVGLMSDHRTGGSPV